MSEKPQEFYWSVKFPKLLGAHDEPLTYAFTYNVQNSFMMSGWESYQRRSGEHDLDHDFTYALIRYPTKRLIMTVDFPRGFGDVEPFIRCSHPKQYPNLRLNPFREFDVPRDGREYQSDTDMTEYELTNLRRTGDRVWELGIEEPLVGYKYEIRWKLPEDPKAPKVEGETTQYQQMLLDYRGLRMEDSQIEKVVNCQKLFTQLFDELFQRYKSVGQNEVFTISLMTYSTEKRRLLIVDEQCNGAEPTSWDFQLGVGEGMAGAAFKQRRVLVASSRRGNYLYSPNIPQTDTSYHAMISAPVYHPAICEDLRPSVAGVIGVINIGSTAPGSGILRLAPESTQNRDFKSEINNLRAVAQGFVESILDILKA